MWSQDLSYIEFIYTSSSCVIGFFWQYQTTTRRNKKDNRTHGYSRPINGAIVVELLGCSGIHCWAWDGCMVIPELIGSGHSFNPSRDAGSPWWLEWGASPSFLAVVCFSKICQWLMIAIFSVNLTATSWSIGRALVTNPKISPIAVCLFLYDRCVSVKLPCKRLLIKIHHYCSPLSTAGDCFPSSTNHHYSTIINH